MRRFSTSCGQTYDQPCNVAGKARGCAISKGQDTYPPARPETRMGEPGERLSVDSGPAPEPDRFQGTNLTRYNALS